MLLQFQVPSLRRRTGQVKPGAIRPHDPVLPSRGRTHSNRLAVPVGLPASACPGHISQERTCTNHLHNKKPYIIPTTKHSNDFKSFSTFSGQSPSITSSPYALPNVLRQLLLAALQAEKPKGLTTRSDHPLCPFVSCVPAEDTTIHR